MKTIALKFNLPLPVCEALLKQLYREYVGPDLADFVLELERRVAAARGGD